MKRRARRFSRQSFEVLEQRTLLTGNVSAIVSDAGDLVVTGDAENNTVWLKQDSSHQHADEAGHVVWLWGDETTQINGQFYSMDNPLGVAGLTRNVNVQLRDGGDTLYAQAMDVPGSMQVDLGHGLNEAYVDESAVGGQLKLRGGRTDDNFYVDRSTVGNRLLVQAFRGPDGVYISNTNARKIDVRAGYGHDEVYVTDIETRRRNRVNGGAGQDYYGVESEGAYATAENDADVQGFEDFGVVNGNNDTVMDAKLDQAIATLGRPRFGEEAHHQAIDEIMESLFISNLVPLPTADQNGQPNQDDLEDFNKHQADLDRAIQALTRHVNVPVTGNDETKAEAADARNFLQLTQEALQVIAGQTAFCHPGGGEAERNGFSAQTTLNGAGCSFLEADDEGGRVIDEVLDNFSRQVRSPFPIVFSGQVPPDEVVFEIPALSDGQCSAVLKEFMGVKAVVTAREIPVWVEPWFARARIVGTRTVWAFEFVPAEYIKTISVCNNDGQIETDVSSVIVHDRGLMHFWRFFDQAG